MIRVGKSKGLWKKEAEELHWDLGRKKIHILEDIKKKAVWKSDRKETRIVKENTCRRLVGVSLCLKRSGLNFAEKDYKCRAYIRLYRTRGFMPLQYSYRQKESFILKF